MFFEDCFPFSQPQSDHTKARGDANTRLVNTLDGPYGFDHQSNLPLPGEITKVVPSTESQGDDAAGPIT